MAKGASGRRHRVGVRGSAGSRSGPLGLGGGGACHPHGGHRHPGHHGRRVTLDLLARPGTLATGERAGLVVVPRPFRAVRRRIDVLRRYRELLQLARREGFGPLLSAQGRIERTNEATGVRVRRLLEDAGGVYVKLGQIAATRVDLISPELAGELAQLQNRVCPESVERIQPVLEAELGQPVDEVFAEFDWEPLAAA